MARQEVALIFNLLQDVNILRGLAYMLRRETEAEIHLLVTAGFLKRDTRASWQPELTQIARDTGADIHVIATDSDTQAALQGRGGVLVAASESDLSAHRETSSILMSAPGSFIKVTLQHGLECVGFRQSREHVIGHGRDIGFNADVVCSWLPLGQLSATRVSERSKIVVTGPSTLLQQSRMHPDHPPLSGGLVCENLHSVRLAATGNHKASFMDIFFDFCAKMGNQKKQVTLRPHPGGQYMLKNNVALPPNIALNNLPMYDVNLRGYQYGISAPSTVVFDMVLAGIPVGVWCDPGGIMDTGNYRGLTEISKVEDWIAFERESRENPADILYRQKRYLEGLDMPTDPQDIYRRYTRLFQNMLGTAARATAPSLPAPLQNRRPKRVLFIANDMLATLQLSFLKPLMPDFDSGNIQYETMTQVDMAEHSGSKASSAVAGQWVTQRIADFKPDIIVSCRYSGPHANKILKAARICKAAVIYHIDDDLLTIPRELGEDKWRSHNAPSRIESVRTFLDHSDMIYVSTPGLHKRLQELRVRAPIFCGDIYCSASVLRKPRPGPVRKVGYMGTSSHAHDFDLILPQIARYLDANPSVTFELFGLNPVPDALVRFGERVQIVPSVSNYAEFLTMLASREWDIGLCPLAQLPFNAVKANTKWVEYTASGMATIASKGLVYDRCADAGRGVLVGDNDWTDALQALTNDADLRHRMAIEAQEHLVQNYSQQRLREQVLRMFDQARTCQTDAGARPPRKVLFITNGMIPTLQLSFLKPLAGLIARNEIICETLTELAITDVFAKERWSDAAGDWFYKTIIDHKPDLIVCCRYSGPHSDRIIRAGKRMEVPVIFHVDDDLMNIPPEIGERKYKAHNDPLRLATVSNLLHDATMVYASTFALRQRLRHQGVKTPIYYGDIYCSSRVHRVAQPGPVRRIGYMGFDHAHDFLVALPALERYLEDNPQVEFELFGSIPMPDVLSRFGDRVRSVPPVNNYAEFLKALAARNWDIGICPLAHTPFNAVKANTKWVEYTASGMATIATKGLVYDTCAGSGRGLLVNSGEWREALQLLTDDADLRYRIALQAQTHLLLKYSEDQLTTQVLDAFARARSLLEDPQDARPVQRLASVTLTEDGLIKAD